MSCRKRPSRRDPNPALIDNVDRDTGVSPVLGAGTRLVNPSSSSARTGGTPVSRSAATPIRSPGRRSPCRCTRCVLCRGGRGRRGRRGGRGGGGGGAGEEVGLHRPGPG